jgi:hypothetical protein
MFGYVFPDKPELKIKEFELFKAYYCGLCKSIGDNCGQVGRFALNYDSSFLGMLLSSFNEGPEVIKLEKCIVNPFVKKPVVKKSSTLSYAGDMNIILAYYKLQDDFNDEKSIKSIAGMGALSLPFKKALKRNPEKGGIIKKRLDELTGLEKSGCKSIDEAAEPFARLTEELFVYSPVCNTERREKMLRWFGYNIGKWIYILDAYDDIERDIKDKGFNPIINQFGYNGGNAADFKKGIRENIGFTLTYTLSQVGKAYELLEVSKNGGIIENIIFGGMYNKTLQILDKRSCLKDEKPL